jgi:8-oxo-dGTP diphosphatase
MTDVEIPTSEGPLQFGRRVAGRAYADRPCAYGVARRDDGRVALARVVKDGAIWWDLPGGALDPGEDEGVALVREFLEETGLSVRPVRLIARGAQFMLKTDGQAVNNLSGFYEASIFGEDPAMKIEDDHTLEWWEAADAVRALRHDSHAWAVAVWMRLTFAESRR